jgi:hypothetical protein
MSHTLEILCVSFDGRVVMNMARSLMICSKGRYGIFWTTWIDAVEYVETNFHKASDGYRYLVPTSVSGLSFGCRIFSQRYTED